MYVPGPPPQDWPALYRELFRISAAFDELSGGIAGISVYGDITLGANEIFTLTVTGNDRVSEYTIHWGDGTSTTHTADGIIQYSYLEAMEPTPIIIDVVSTARVSYPAIASWPVSSIDAIATPSLIRDYTTADLGEGATLLRESISSVDDYDGHVVEIPDHAVPFCDVLVCRSFMLDLSTKTKTIIQDGTSGWTEDTNVDMTLDATRGAYLYTISATSGRRIDTDQTTGGFDYYDREFLFVLDIEPVADTDINLSIRLVASATILGSATLSVTAAEGRRIYCKRVSTTNVYSGNVIASLYDESGSTGDRFYLYQIDIQDVTDRAEQDIPRPMTNYGEGDTYNSGVDGLQYIANDWSGTTVDVDDVVTYAEGNDLTGYLDWQPPVINLAVSPHNWASSQVVTLPEAGQYTISLKGDAVLAVAAGTAVGTGWWNATEASPLTVTITSDGGTITLTKSAGDFDQILGRDLLQVEAGPINTRIHPPIEDAGRTRASMALGYSDTGLSEQSGLIVTKFRLTNDPDVIGYGNGILTYDPADNASVFTPDEDSELFIDDTSPFSAGDTIVTAVAYNDFWGTMRTSYSVNGGTFVTDGVVQEYEEDYETVGLNDYFVTPDFPVQIDAIYVYSTNPGLDWVASQTW